MKKEDIEILDMMEIVEKRHYHLSNGGLTVTATQDMGEHPGVRIDIDINTFGCMGATISLGSHEYSSPFLNSMEMLNLAHFFVNAAKLTAEAEIARVDRLEEKTKTLDSNHPFQKKLVNEKKKVNPKKEFVAKVEDVKAQIENILHKASVGPYTNTDESLEEEENVAAD